jgi:2'-5' RNA ligase
MPPGAPHDANTDTRLRVFFALWPDAAAAARLHNIALQQHARLAGRVMRLDSLHATLVFIGDIAAGRLNDLLAVAEGVHQSGFRLSFDHAGCWRHNRIAYLGLKQMPQALQNLQASLAARVNAAGFKLDERVFSPHVTLLRKAECGESGKEKPKEKPKENPAPEPVAWTVRDFVLVKSSLGANGSRYEQIGSWPLL